LKLAASAALRISVIRAVKVVQELCEGIGQRFLDDRIVKPPQSGCPVWRWLSASPWAVHPDVLHPLVSRLLFFRHSEC
jgi:hypothetical protein